MVQLGKIGNEVTFTGPTRWSPSCDRGPQAARVPGSVHRLADYIVASLADPRASRPEYVIWSATIPAFVPLGPAETAPGARHVGASIGSLGPRTEAQNVSVGRTRGRCLDRDHLHLSRRYIQVRYRSSVR
jgi:hypothetical protein